MEIKDLLTPAFTVMGVCLAAHYALRNEHRKKALEIETSQLDRLSVLVLNSLDNFAQYAGALAGIIDAQITILTKQLPPPNRDNAEISVADLHNWLDQIDSHPAWGLNRSELQKASHGLRFHREADWLRWQEVVPQLQREIYAFFMITLPGEENIELMRRGRTAAEARAFAKTMRIRISELRSLQKALLSSMKDDFSKLLIPEQTTTFCSMTNSLWYWMRRFFACRF